MNNIPIINLIIFILGGLAGVLLLVYLALKILSSRGITVDIEKKADRKKSLIDPYDNLSGDEQLLLDMIDVDLNDFVWLKGPNGKMFLVNILSIKAIEPVGTHLTVFTEDGNTYTYGI